MVHGVHCFAVILFFFRPFFFWRGNAKETHRPPPAPFQALESFQAKGDTTTPVQQTGSALATNSAAPATAAAGGAPGPGRVAAVEPPSSDAREALRFLFGKDGEFFREFLLDEVSKYST